MSTSLARPSRLEVSELASAAIERSREQAEYAPQLPSLTGLRFFAALLVVGVHFGSQALPPLLQRVALSGAVGVSLFFVLSGFILTYTYCTPAGTLRGSRADFYWARFARIYPIYGFGLLVGIAPALWVHIEGPVSPVRALIASLLLVQAWLPWDHYVWNGPGWSLSAEVCFYAVFPFALCIICRIRPGHLLFAATLCYCAALATPFLYLRLQPDAGSTASLPLWQDVVLYNPIPHLPEFFFGMVIGRLFLVGRTWRLRGTGLLSTVAAGAILVALYDGTQLGSLYLRDGALIPLFGLLIWTLAYQRGHLSGILSTRLLVLLGEASYSLYILHWPTHALLVRWLGISDLQAAQSLVFFCGYLVVVISCSIATYLFIERPSRIFLRSVRAVH